MKILHLAMLIAIMTMLCSAAYSWGVIEKGPYLQNIGKNHITIMWESLYNTKSRIDYGITEEYGLFAEGEKEVDIHEVTLRPLKPDTVYYYKITSGLSSKTGHFRTAPDYNAPFKFIVYGDTQANPDIHEKIAAEMLRIEPDLIFHTGDLVSNGNRYHQWSELFFDPLQGVINHIPIYTALGNHERNARHYFKFLSLPNNESWYSFNYSNCHFVALDSNKDFSRGSPQYRWLKNDLRNTNTKWKMVFFHHPPYSSGRHPSNLKARNILTPLFRKHGVDIVFCGHNHQYERSHPIGSAFGVNENPITYVVSGGGGGNLYDFTPDMPWTKTIVKDHNFCVVSIDGGELNFRAFDLKGKELDKFSITKARGEYQEYLKNTIYYEQMEFENNLLDNITPPVVLMNSGKALYEDTIKIKNSFPGKVSFKIIWNHLNDWDIRPKQTVVEAGGNKIARIPFTFHSPRKVTWPPPAFTIAYDTGLKSGRIGKNYLRVLSPKNLSCGRSGKSIEIDGRLKESFWNDIPLANSFIRTDFSGLADGQTSAKVAYGEDSLYLALVCSSKGSIIARASKRDENLLNDEAVIVSIAPHRGGKMVYQFGVNCDGVEYDAKGGFKEWSGQWKSATRTEDGSWTVEMAIPYTVLELPSAPKKGDRWKINFFRSSAEIHEKSEWSATLNSPLDVKRLGILRIN